MYAKSIAIYGFKCFGKADVEFCYPGRPEETVLEHPNINLILGDNGRGKSSVLRAIAIAALAPALITGGFVAYRLVRRDAEGDIAKNSLLKLLGLLDESELPLRPSEPVAESGRQVRPRARRSLEFLARLRARLENHVC
jgi:hypothetical protein